jgi:hypothetical protein
MEKITDDLRKPIFFQKSSAKNPTNMLPGFLIGFFGGYQQYQIKIKEKIATKNQKL